MQHQFLAVVLVSTLKLSSRGHLIRHCVSGTTENETPVILGGSCFTGREEENRWGVIWIRRKPRQQNKALVFWLSLLKDTTQRYDCC